MSIKVLVCGCAGKVGKEVVKGVLKEKDLKLVGGVDVVEVNKDIGEIAGLGKIGISINNNLDEELKKRKPDVMIDFTTPNVVMKNIEIACKNRVAQVIGTTGFDREKLEKVKKFSKEYNTPVFIAPNFAIGAVLMMKIAKEVAKYFNDVEIIELHHNQKLDAPSGTSLTTANMIKEVLKKKQDKKEEIEKLSGVRGGEIDGIRIHSIRLPGLVAHQEIIFGGVGQILTIRHDSISRESFIPGVLLAIRKVLKLKGLVYGLENLL
jgi:4-hydroxy-tetrahydrodipicolinate reductase